ncbi:hypothetical protein BDW62DRAFT_20479 [Aspergillus aurantiobrunneus]
MYRTWESQVPQLDIFDRTRGNRASITQHSLAMMTVSLLLTGTIIRLCLTCFVNPSRKRPVYLVLCHNQCISFVVIEHFVALHLRSCNSVSVNMKSSGSKASILWQYLCDG